MYHVLVNVISWLIQLEPWLMTFRRLGEIVVAQIDVQYFHVIPPPENQGTGIPRSLIQTYFSGQG